MKRMIIICLVSNLLASQACSTEVANTQVLPANGQEINRNKEGREANVNLPETNTRKGIQAGQADKSSIGNTKGLVVLSERYGKNDFIRFYNEDGSLWYEFTFYYDDSDGKFEYENENFRAFAFHPDNFVLALKCVGDDGSRYEVVVNEETGLKKFVKKNDPTMRLQTWEEHILKLFAVGFDREKNPIRETPEGPVKTADLPKDVTFHPVKIKGEWLQVHWNSLEKEGKNDQSGWVRWREDNKILVELFYSS